jgi:hypothetical protein
MMSEELISSDHKMVVMDWRIDTKIEEIREKEEEEIKVTNKRKGGELEEKDWKKYKSKIEVKLAGKEGRE